MTELYFYQDSYLTELSAEITEIGEHWIKLDRTLFYPLGGGQPGDTGKLVLASGTLEIINATKQAGSSDVLHHIDPDSNQFQPVVGDQVTMQIDWQRRYQHMRMHTAMHLLGSLIKFPVTGGQVGAAKSRLDFNLDGIQLDKMMLTEQLNQLIKTGRDLAFETITDAELDANPELVRTMSVQPPKGAGIIRMVRIPDIDYQPCGGTHIGNLSEIGELRVSKIENKGKQNRRVHLVFADGL
jgi:misacylated tRNA(Ala) deacylase